MSFKQIHIIINPASGEEKPILSYLNRAFHESEVSWSVSVTQRDGDAERFARKALGKADLIAVYGGDGSISEVARVMKGSNVPMAIIPGGTANVISKELGIPQDTASAIELIRGEKYSIIQMDMALANEELFLIRVNLGIMASMVAEATRELKDKIGQLAYGVTAIKTLITADSIRYNLKIDGQIVSTAGVALTITNCGSVGINDYSFLPDIKVNDGLLDVILLKRADLMSVLRVAGSTLLKTDSEVLEHWRGKEIEISFEQKQNFILDDCQREASRMVIKILPQALKVVVPMDKSF